MSSTVAMRSTLQAVRTACGTVSGLTTSTNAQDVTTAKDDRLPAWSATLVQTERGPGRGTPASPFWVTDTIEVATLHKYLPGEGGQTTEYIAQDHVDAIILACTGPTLRQYDPQHLRTRMERVGGRQYLAHRIIFTLRRLETVGARTS